MRRRSQTFSDDEAVVSLPGALSVASTSGGSIEEACSIGSATAAIVGERISAADSAVCSRSSPD
jgi:hypothetical protein